MVPNRARLSDGITIPLNRGATKTAVEPLDDLFQPVGRLESSSKGGLDVDDFGMLGYGVCSVL